jgi:hypothetical protein
LRKRRVRRDRVRLRRQRMLLEQRLLQQHVQRRHVSGAQYDVQDCRQRVSERQRRLLQQALHERRVCTTVDGFVLHSDRRHLFQGRRLLHWCV